MRNRQALAALFVSSALALAACGSDSDSGSDDSGDGSGGAVVTDDMGVKVDGDTGEKPTLTVPDTDPADELQVQVLSEGDGPEVGADDVVVADYLGQTWEPRAPQATPSAQSGGSTAAPDGATDAPSSPAAEPTGEPEPYVFDNSYDRGEAAGFSLNQVIPGWKDGLTGQKVGSRILLSIPPDQGYGTQEGHDLQNDTLVFVVDIHDAIDPKQSASGEAVADLPADMPKVETNEGEAPSIDFGGAADPKASDSTVTVKGDGPELKNNFVVNLVQASYPDGADAISTWDEGQTPQVLRAEDLAGIPGLSEAIEGQKVGTRVVTRIAAKDNPAEDGSEGTPLVLVIDVIGTF